MFKLAPLFGDHAILPIGKELRIFGTADEGETVAATLTAADGTMTGQGCSTAREGRFLIHLPAQTLGSGALTLTLRSESGTQIVSDLRVGFLFMAGGQSNMEWGLWNAKNGQTFIRTHNDPELRYFNVPRVSVLNEKGLAEHAGARWQQIAPGVGGDMSGVAYFFARMLRAKTGFPVGVIGCNWGATSVLSWMDEVALARNPHAAQAAADYDREYADVTLEEWLRKQEAFQQVMDAWNTHVEKVKQANPGIAWLDVEKQTGPCPWNPPPGPGSPYRPGQLARTMVETIVPAALSGILYYQGETDAGRAEQYSDLLIGLVTRWRELFGDMELPFYNVQLPMFIDAGAQDDYSWAVLRNQQEKAWRTLRNSYLAVMIDKGEYGNIHPVDKMTPGVRLARLFLENFAHTQPAQPFAMRKSTCGNVLTVELTGPVEARHGEPDLFEVAGEDGVWHAARAEIDWAKIHLSAEGVAHPVKARYAYVNYAKVHVFAAHGDHLPLAPFVMEE